MHPSLTLGLLAGGRATRLGGRDKAWTVFDGQPLVARTLAALQARHRFAECLVSANRNFDRYPALGLRAIPDRLPDFPGPLAGIDALLDACSTPWLLTVPIDLLVIPNDLLAGLQAAGEGGAVACDASGLQPLVAMWPVARSREVVADALARGEAAVHRVVATLALHVVRFDNVAFGNLNTPEDFLT